ncbi:hypothetical protein [Spelaeicoccus albus]|nr:hypothetical protein [Spelaeicoccus albus]
MDYTAMPNKAKMLNGETAMNENPRPGRARALVTGSRHWSVREAVAVAWPGLDSRPDKVLVHGGCPTGVDEVADQYWLCLGLSVEVFPGDWSKYGKKAGPIRNQQMADLGAELAPAF